MLYQFLDLGQKYEVVKALKIASGMPLWCWDQAVYVG